MHAHHGVFAQHFANSGGGNWFGHMLMSGVIHQAIYHIMSPIFHALGPIGSIVLAVVIIFVGFKLSRRLGF